jgi:hypothetical protein
MTHSSSFTTAVQFLRALVWLLLSTATTNAAEAAPQPSCACIAQGKRFAQGETACIYGQRMVCSMNQNISAWKSDGGSCQVSQSDIRMFTKSFTLM